VSQEGGPNDAASISIGDYIYHRQIVFLLQERAKPISLEISYIYESIGSNSITVRYKRIEKKMRLGKFVSYASSFNPPIERTFTVPFNKDKLAVLRVGEEPLGQYVIMNKGRIIRGVCRSEPGQDIPLLVDDKKQLTIKKQEAGKK
jgi:hypothetical protein